tara:strand:+ start:2451 stop:2954 length:504 start_codon:yes stop_codon:yes gene_type:complete
MKILDKINNWTLNGPMGNDLQMPEYDIEDLIQLSVSGQTGALAEETGFVDVGQGSTWAQDWGAYLHPYEVQGERMAVAAFQEQQSSELTKGVTELWGAYSAGGRTGFGSSYGAESLVENSIGSTSSAISLARKAKDHSIFRRREDWVDSLWDTMAELADLGAFPTDD